MPLKLSKNLVVNGLLILALAISLAGCGSNKRAQSSKLGLMAAQTAKKYLGVPYVYGGRSPKGFDCSGLVWYVYRQNGLQLPNASWKQAQFGQKIKRSELAPGDLIFFQSKGRVNHVGIYVGRGQMIHAPGRGRKVTTVTLDDKYYKTHYALARRVAR
ncbi:MAG: C40 family peptidase [Deltaproteobacteria bacterium]|jgi:cell wall-associated NlpC family hydrolase|nr:C40 family peptidase [Deltaproteobacteria bacterium]